MTDALTTTATPAAAASVMLHDGVTPALVEQLRVDGYAVLRNALTPQEVDEVNGEVVRLCRGDLGAIQNSALTNQEFSARESDEDVLRRFLCIHYPHKVSEIIRRLIAKPNLVSALTQCIGPNVKAMQSMLFVKSEGKPGQAWHQDEHFIPTRDRSLTAVWIALDDATIENGCLWVIPGSHRRGVLYPDRELDDPAFDCSREAYDFPYSDHDAVPVQIPAGAGVIFNGYLLHRSLENSGKHGYRRALAYHYMSAESLLPWFDMPEGVHVGEHDFRDIVMVAGEDPYAWKGVDDVTRPISRPVRQGGCDW